MARSSLAPSPASARAALDAASDGLPDLLGVVLDEAGRGKVLRQLAVAAATDRERLVDDEAGRSRRPLVDREQHEENIEARDELLTAERAAPRQPAPQSPPRPLLVLERFEHVQPRGAAGREHGRCDPGHDRDDHESDQRNDGKREGDAELRRATASRARPAPRRVATRARRRSATSRPPRAGSSAAPAGASSRRRGASRARACARRRPGRACSPSRRARRSPRARAARRRGSSRRSATASSSR